jgi:hypothetical protein
MTLIFKLKTLIAWCKRINPKTGIREGDSLWRQLLGGYRHDDSRTARKCVAGGRTKLFRSKACFINALLQALIAWYERTHLKTGIREGESVWRQLLGGYRHDDSRTARKCVA